MLCFPHKWSFNSFVASYPRARALSPDPDEVTIHHTRLVQCHPGVQSLQGHRRPECDLREQGPPQGVGIEKDTLGLASNSCTDRGLPCLPPCQPHLCGQQPGGQENCFLRTWEILCQWWVQLARGEEHLELRYHLRSGAPSFTPIMLLALPSI